MFEVMQDERLAHTLSDEGVIENVIGFIEKLGLQARAGIAAMPQDVPSRQ